MDFGRRIGVRGARGRVIIKSLLFLFFCLSITPGVYAAHPLITDDTGTQGKGKYQLEINSEYSHDRDDGITLDTAEIRATLSYGMTDNADIIIGLPYQSVRVKDPESTTRENGVSDISIEMKWRIYDKDGFSLALKPGLTLPSGDDEKGLGAGRATYSLLLVASKEMQPFVFHLNAGYIRNDNKADERVDIWHLSIASTVEVMKDLKLAANIGAERNSDKSSNTAPAFILGGIIYSFSESLDLDLGIKGGLNKPETDFSILAGIARRF
ncbi:MAG: transporter [Nitrospirota bacterium]